MSAELDERDRRLLRLCVCSVLGRWDDLRALRAAAPPGEPDRAWRETVLQAHLFAGFPRIVEAYGVLAGAGGLGALEADEVRAEPDRPDAGLALFERIYGEGSGRVRAALAAGHPDFADFVLGHAYGRVLARPGLAADRRELLAVAALAALGQDRQLASHARGAVRCGADPGAVREALDAVRDLVAPERVERAEAVIERFARDPE